VHRDGRISPWQSRLEEADALKLFQAAVDRGINFSDNSGDYNQGESERRVGKALKGRRDKVFVMSKFDGRTKEPDALAIPPRIDAKEAAGYGLHGAKQTLYGKLFESIDEPKGNLP
jgi:aryl-alcohol dehydrogenase-like predicted oxidoreductase